MIQRKDTLKSLRINLTNQFIGKIQDVLYSVYQRYLNILELDIYLEGIYLTKEKYKERIYLIYKELSSVLVWLLQLYNFKLRIMIRHGKTFLTK